MAVEDLFAASRAHSNQKLVTIGDFEMALLVLDNTTVQVNNLIIRADGFSVDNASLDVASVT